MKKTIVAILTIGIMLQQSVFAEEGIWNTVDKSFSNGVDYSSKVGDYFFKFESEYSSEDFKEVSYLLCSTDGVNFTKTEYRSSVLPTYKNGLYFVFDTSMDDVPENKRTYGFNNAPAYILNSVLQAINTLNNKYYMSYLGIFNGWHYIGCTDYSDIKYDGNKWTGNRKDIIYKTSDGNELITVSEDEDISFLSGKVLYNNDILFTTYDEKSEEFNTLSTPNGTFEVLFENDYHKGYTYNRTIPLMSMYAVVGEKTVTSADGREYRESIEKKYLTMDGVYGVEMPDDIGSYCFEINGNYYFEKDENHYYCIDESELKNKIKVVYDNKILAFATPPVIEDDRTLVPMRFLFEQMGADVDWDDNTKTAIVNRQNETITFSIDNTTATVNSIQKTMDVPARLINDKTLVPLRFLSEELGFDVQWDEGSQTVTIK
ncbi:MAG: stalk domain-containing protein [Clostridiales bacterium]|nr:stalk domain-containing protein [Clostridiales bacterium]